MSDFIEIEFLSGCLGVMPKRALRLCAEIDSGYYVYDADDKLYSEDRAFHKSRAVSKQEYLRICTHLKCLTRKSFVKSRLAPDDFPAEPPKDMGFSELNIADSFEWKPFLYGSLPRNGDKIHIKHGILGELVVDYEEVFLRTATFEVSVIMNLKWGGNSVRLLPDNKSGFLWIELKR